MNREIHLAARPVGTPDDSTFELVDAPMPQPADGEVLVRNVYMSVDPYMRGRMNDVKSYTPPFEVGATLQGGAIGRVVESRHPDFQPGAFVQSALGWRDYFAAPAADLQALPQGDVPLSYYLGVLGMPGLTAYVGLLDMAPPKEGETVFVSGAAGAVGSIVGQIAAIHGCRVVGSAGSDEKVAYLRDDLGFDAVFNYKTLDAGTGLDAALADACPDGLDVYFDNVGGDHLQAALNHINEFGRIAACGSISRYNDAEPAPGPNNLFNVVRRKLRIQGFIVSDHFDRLPAFRADMQRWLKEGAVRSRETVVDGLENAPQAFLGLFRGDNIGKMIVKIAPETEDA